MLRNEQLSLNCKQKSICRPFLPSSWKLYGQWDLHSRPRQLGKGKSLLFSPLVNYQAEDCGMLLHETSCTHNRGGRKLCQILFTMFQQRLTSLPVAITAHQLVHGRNKMDARCHLVCHVFLPTLKQNCVSWLSRMLLRHSSGYFSQYFGKTTWRALFWR